jgi:muramoyltetrapeptide carboxypeptidase
MTRTTLHILKPPRLRRGDCIGLVAPASTPSSSEKIEKGVRYLESLGYRVIVGKHVSEVYGYLAGTDEQRASDFNSMVADANVKAIIAIRGGYGTPRILPLIDYRSLKRNPKIIVGYSDVTALQLAIFRKTGLVTFSGPMSGVEMWDGIDPYTEDKFWRIITSNKKVEHLRNPDEETLAIMRAGTGSGRILGGNFALVASLIGTPYMPDLKKAILVLEDVDEAPHRIDRMLAQLSHAGILKNLSGLVFGKFTDCVPSDPTKPYLTIDQILQEIPAKVTCPVIANFQYGHIAKKLTIPLGLKGRIETKSGMVEVVENAVS